MSDGTGDLARLLARLDEEGLRMEEHLAAERLTAYDAGELSAAEYAAVEAHLANCSFCLERLRDLRRFLSPRPEDLPAEGLADFETAAQWRELQKKLPPRPARLRRLFAAPGFSVAAVLAVALGLAAYRIVSLERELASPITDLVATTLEEPGSRKAEPATTQPPLFKLGHVAAFEILPEHPYPRYRLIFRDADGRVVKSVEDTEDDGQAGVLTLFLPRRFLPPGLYRVEAVGLDGAEHAIRTFEVRLAR